MKLVKNFESFLLEEKKKCEGEKKCKCDCKESGECTCKEDGKKDDK